MSTIQTVTRIQAEDALLVTIMFRGPVEGWEGLHEQLSEPHDTDEIDSGELRELFAGLESQDLIEFRQEGPDDPGTWYLTERGAARCAVPDRLRRAALRQRVDMAAQGDIADAIRDHGVMWRGEMRGLRDAILTLAAAVRGRPVRPEPGPGGGTDPCDDSYYDPDTVDGAEIEFGSGTTRAPAPTVPPGEEPR